MTAADLIEKNGWFTTRDPSKAGNLYCAATAICSVLHFKESSEDLTYFRKYLLRLNLTEKDVISWNDSEGQTSENVIKTLREAANSLGD